MRCMTERLKELPSESHKNHETRDISQNHGRSLWVLRGLLPMNHLYIAIAMHRSSAADKRLKGILVLFKAPATKGLLHATCVCCHKLLAWWVQLLLKRHACTKISREPPVGLDGLLGDQGWDIPLESPVDCRALIAALTNPIRGHSLCCRAGSRPVRQMPMHRSDFDGDAYVTVCIGQILKFLILL